MPVAVAWQGRSAMRSSTTSCRGSWVSNAFCPRSAGPGRMLLLSRRVFRAGFRFSISPAAGRLTPLKCFELVFHEEDAGSDYNAPGASGDIGDGRARLRPSRHWHSARTEARPPGMSQNPPPVV